jgi:UDP-N-acetylmuramoyl-tripeptide--D-alanyl-D-alanine ligase
VSAAAPVPSFAWTVAAVREALGHTGIADPADAGRRFRGISTDTRTLLEGDLFVALEGPRFDGHDYVAVAAERGATGAVVRRVPAARPEGFLLFPVPDTLEALGALAHYRRLRLPARVVAITGSSGKTTTKEILRAAVEGSLRTHATRANLNNRIGVPLTLLEAPADAQVVLVEVGTSEPGEIAALRSVAHPDVAVVTTVSEAHVERLGDLEGVFREKLSLLDRLPSGATVVVGDDPAELADRAPDAAPGHPLRVAGLSERADQPWRGRLVESDAEGRWRVATPSGSFLAPVPGAHGARCALLALAVADLLGVPPEAARAGIARTALPGLRSEIRRLGAGTLLVDCYNANPQSTRAAVAWLSTLPSEGPRIAVLGSMLELGPRSGAHHEEVLREALETDLDRIIAVGLFAETPAAREDRSGRVIPAADAGAARSRVLEAIRPGATVLLKGSRGVALELLLPDLEQALGGRGEGDGAPTGGGG